MGINNPEKPPDPRQATAYLLQHFKDDYGLFWKIKLNNFAACVQRWPALWKLFSDIDHLIAAEIDVCESLTQERQLYPQFLFIRSHAQFRLALELAFSLALTEAESLMRVAIESAVNGSKLYKEPHLLDSWLGREEESLKKVYDSHFVANRRKNLFTGLPELDLLYTMWCDYSERSSHTSMSDLHLRIELKEAGTDDTLRHAGLH